MAELLQLVDSGKISIKLAKSIWPKMWNTGKGAAQIAEGRKALRVELQQMTAAYCRAADLQTVLQFDLVAAGKIQVGAAG